MTRNVLLPYDGASVKAEKKKKKILTVFPKTAEKK